jgi:hypothetical protein
MRMSRGRGVDTLDELGRLTENTEPLSFVFQPALRTPVKTCGGSVPEKGVNSNWWRTKMNQSNRTFYTPEVKKE